MLGGPTLQGAGPSMGHQAARIITHTGGGCVVDAFMKVIFSALTVVFSDVRGRSTHSKRPASPAEKHRRISASKSARKVSVLGIACMLIGSIAAGSWLALLVPIGLVAVAIAWLRGDRLGLTVVGAAYVLWNLYTVIWVMVHAG
jgi:hypothetical protein